MHLSNGIRIWIFSLPYYIATKMLKRTNIREEIECKLPYGEENRVDYIIELIKELS